MNGVDSLGSNQECRIGYRHSHSRVSQCLASIRKLGNRRSSEGLRSFKPSKETNLFILIILAGDIEMNPGPRFQCGLCKKYCKASDRLLECEECEKGFHASCSNLGDNELVRIESDDGAWYCTNCKADCGLCSGAVLKAQKAVRGARWLSGRVSDSGARGPGFETYLRRVVSLSKTLYTPKVLVNYPGSDGSVPT